MIGYMRAEASQMPLVTAVTVGMIQLPSPGGK